MTIEIVKEPEPIDLGFDAHMAAHAAAEVEPSPKKEEPVVPAAIVNEPKKDEPIVAKVDDKPGEKKDEPVDDAQLVTDPDTGEKVDKRTREGKRIFSLLERAHKAEALIATLLANQNKPAAKEEKPAEAPVAPKPEDFPTTDAYIAAAVQFGIDQHLPAAVRAATQGLTQSRETETRNAAIDVREAKFLETHPDYREVLKTGLLPDLSAGVARKHPTALALKEMFETSEDGPRLAYMVGKDPALHARLAALPPGSALLELGKLASVPAKPADDVEKPKPRSQAPPPPEPPEARTTVAESDPMNLSFDEHVAAGNAADRQRAKSRRASAA